MMNPYTHLVASLRALPQPAAAVAAMAMETRAACAEEVLKYLQKAEGRPIPSWYDHTKIPPLVASLTSEADVGLVLDTAEANHLDLRGAPLEALRALVPFQARIAARWDGLVLKQRQTVAHNRRAGVAAKEARQVEITNETTRLCAGRTVDGSLIWQKLRAFVELLYREGLPLDHPQVPLEVKGALEAPFPASWDPHQALNQVRFR